jgi:hypothetical protein
VFVDQWNCLEEIEDFVYSNYNRDKKYENLDGDDAPPQQEMHEAGRSRDFMSQRKIFYLFNMVRENLFRFCCKTIKR